ncbi:hypothetical protein DIPPA_32951 [Diplonema papillatum]|nr:hypothetical protein DIPPA_11090 [Diplonema papillatum]KAJ9442826.1 hypothetical protein DIPPA_32951 [Diplonema papillatum]
MSTPTPSPPTFLSRPDSEEALQEEAFSPLCLSASRSIEAGWGGVERLAKPPTPPAESPPAALVTATGTQPEQPIAQFHPGLVACSPEQGIELSSPGALPLADVPSTRQRLIVTPSAEGPAVYVGGAPMPGAKVAKPTPDAIHRLKEEAALDKIAAEQEHAHTARTAAQATATLRERITLNLNVAKASLASHMARRQVRHTEKQSRDSTAACQRRFAHAFPGTDDVVIACFQCTYTDGNTSEHAGWLAVTQNGLRFASEAKPATKETIPHSRIAAVKEEEGAGARPQLAVYTTDCKLYRFAVVEMGQKGMVDESPNAAAFNWIDHIWRKSTTVPNPAATYYAA